MVLGRGPNQRASPTSLAVDKKKKERKKKGSPFDTFLNTCLCFVLVFHTANYPQGTSHPQHFVDFLVE